MLLQNDPLFTTLSRFAAHANGQNRPYPAPMDAYRRDGNVWVHIDLPGVAADSLDISVERSVLTVTGERWADRQDGDQVYLSDREQGRFRRQVHLGEGLDAEHIEADYHDGVLTLRVPVAEQAKPRKIEIKAGAPVIDTAEVDTPAAATADDAS